MTAVDTVIAELASGRSSSSPQNVICTISDFILALQEIQSGLTPSGPEAANSFYAGPGSGAPALPAFRAIVKEDLANTLLLSIGNCAVNSATVPTNGTYLAGANLLGFATNSILAMTLDANGVLDGKAAAGWTLNSGNASNVNPTLIPNGAALTTGWGAQAAGNISGILGGTEVVRLVANGWTFPDTTKGIVGTTTNDDAVAGNVGEYITATIPSSGATAWTSGAGGTANLLSITLTAGDWDVWASIGDVPGGGTTRTLLRAGISLVSATFAASYDSDFLTQVFAAGGAVNAAIPSVRVTGNASQSVFLVARADFAVSTEALCGRIQARRRR